MLLIDTLQICSLSLSTLLCATLLFMLPRGVFGNSMLNKSRWMMIVALALLVLQFSLQYVFDFRESDVTRAVFVNLLFFIPCSWLLAMALLNLLNDNRLPARMVKTGVATWVVVACLLCVALFVGDNGTMASNRLLRLAEYVACFVYCLMLIWQMVEQMRGLRRLSRALNNYYDEEIDSILRWMKHAIIMLASIGVTTPLFILSSGMPLFIFAVIIFVSIYYLVLCFICYCVSNDAGKISEATKHTEQTDLEVLAAHRTIDISEQERISQVVDRWVAERKHLRSGITMQTAVDEMNIPRYIFAAWLKTTPYELFNPWLTHLRIEEAKHLLITHPDWSNDAIATQCGFSSRSYFQSVFKKITGKTPLQYATAAKA